MPEWLDKGNSRVFAAASPARKSLIVRSRLEGNAESFDAARIAIVIELHASDPDSRVVTLRHESRKKIELTIRPPYGRGIKGAFDFLRVARLRLHEEPHAL
jgi:hypothetical protein